MLIFDVICAKRHAGIATGEGRGPAAANFENPEIPKQSQIVEKHRMGAIPETEPESRKAGKAELPKQSQFVHMQRDRMEVLVKQCRKENHLTH